MKMIIDIPDESIIDIQKRCKEHCEYITRALNDSEVNLIAKIIADGSPSPITQGKWLNLGLDGATCSECNKRITFYGYGFDNYCSNCGAKMDKND